MAADITDAKASGQPAKPHGDKLNAPAGSAKPIADSQPGTGDSPKRQGDPMAATLKSGKA